MCLHLKDPNQTKPNIAEQDIYCLKVVEGYDPETGRCLSFYQAVNQRVGKLMKSKLDKIVIGYYTGHPLIERGLHAIRLGHSLIEYSSQYMTIMLAKIPKGSKYYEGANGDIVANQMILIEPLVSNADGINLEVDLGPSTLSFDKAFKLANRILKKEGYKFSK